MRKVIVTEFLTLDGVMEDPGGAEHSEHGGWTTKYGDAGVGAFKFQELFAADALLLGRVTYQGFAEAWPERTDDEGFADRMNALPKYVASRTLRDADWNNSLVLAGDLATEVIRLKEQPGEDILIYGSGELVRSLMQHDLIDEYRFLVYPIVLGGGMRLFADGVGAALRLVDAKPYECGVVALTYQPANR